MTSEIDTTKLSADDLEVGSICDIDLGWKIMRGSTIIFIGKDVGAYLDCWGNEFTFAINSVTFYKASEEPKFKETK